MSSVLNLPAIPSVLAHRTGTCALDNAFALIEGHPACVTAEAHPRRSRLGRDLRQRGDATVKKHAANANFIVSPGGSTFTL